MLHTTLLHAIARSQPLKKQLTHDANQIPQCINKKNKMVSELKKYGTNILMKRL